jgi:hypothetical protein
VGLAVAALVCGGLALIIEIRGELVRTRKELERGNAIDIRIVELLERNNAIAYARSARASVKEPTRSSLLAASSFRELGRRLGVRDVTAKRAALEAQECWRRRVNRE